VSLPYFVVDAFTSRPFAGNPAAVVPLERWLPDDTMKQIAAEMALSETAFLCEGRIRWFTPMVEVDLCGHATLGTAHVYFSELAKGTTEVRFASASGGLTVKKDGDVLVLDFPARPPHPFDDAGVIEPLVEALGARPREVMISRDLVAIFDSADEIRAIKPDMTRLAAIDTHGVIVTARGDEPGVDFVSRFFTPQQGVPEDPVTGSAHCTLIPLWAGRLGKQELRARQLSRRGGELRCALRGDRVDIGGHAVLVARGTLFV
jgi:PhzF family phenazine biosynthesis protein